MRFLGIILGVLLLLPGTAARADDALYRVTGDKVNVRQGPGKNYRVLRQCHRGDIVTVTGFVNDNWASIRYTESTFAYIHRNYISYVGPVQVPEEPKSKDTRTPSSVLDVIFKVAKIIALALLGLGILLSFADADAAGRLFTPFALYIVGYVVGFMCDEAHLGAIIGEGVGFVLLIGGAVADGLSWYDISDFFGSLPFNLWRIVSWPFFALNCLQLFLSKPWRPWMKTDWAAEKDKGWIRTTFAILKIPCYILAFPLRVVNAVYYNLFVHLLYELSNYFLEVFSPSDSAMGRDDAWTWIVWFPVRLVYFLGFHFPLSVVESVIWTVLDAFIPTVTLFHGTRDSSAAQMVCEPRRTRESRKLSSWTDGTWNVGGGNYAGDGIYFGISRKTLQNYQKGSCIVARVSPGRTIDISLMPFSVYQHAGHADAHEVSKWGLTHGYTTGEWWRSGGDWWEFCLFDRQNRYNYSWRIRPVYVLDYSKGIMQRVPRGTAHWLFRGMVLRDMGDSLKRLFT